MLDHRLQNPASKGDTPISIEGLAKELLRDGVYYHIARPGIKGNHLLGCGPRGNSGEISNPSKVLQDAPAAGMAKEYIVQKRNQGRSFAPGSHIRRTEIRNDGHFYLCGNHSGFPRLPGAGNRTVQE